MTASSAYASGCKGSIELHRIIFGEALSDGEYPGFDNYNDSFIETTVFNAKISKKRMLRSEFCHSSISNGQPVLSWARCSIRRQPKLTWKLFRSNEP
jgi:hypothetical protein